MTILLLAAGFVLVTYLFAVALCWSAAAGDRAMERAREEAEREKRDELASVTRLWPRAARTDVSVVPRDPGDDAA